MRRVMVRYKVKEGRSEENEAYIERVFEELQRDRPSGFRYVSFKLEDGLSFVHIVSEESENGDRSLADFPSFQTFTAQIADRCDDPPVATELTEIGSYRFFADDRTGVA